MMLKPKAITKDGKSKGVDYLMATEYYIGADGQPKTPSMWTGKLAQELGIDGKVVEQKVLERIFDGYSPNGKEPLPHNAGRDSRKNLAYDAPIVVPKSVSIVYAHSTPEMREKIIQALQRSSAAAIEHLENRIQIRTGKAGKHKGHCEGLAVANFLHVEDRAGEPHLHLHIAIASMAATIDAGGNRRIASLDSVELHSHVYAAGAIADCVMARELSALGIVIEEGQKHGYRVAAVPLEVEKSLSKRGDEITDETSKKGRVGKKARDLAQADTKGEKKHLTPDEMDKAWEATAKKTGWGQEQAQEALGHTVRTEAEVMEILRSQADEILDGLSRKRGVFTGDEALMNIALRASALGGLAPAEINRIHEEILEQAEVISLGNQAETQKANGKSFGTGTRQIFTTVRALSTDMEIFTEFEKASKDQRHIHTGSKIEDAIKKFEAMKSAERGKPVKLKAEQRAMVEHVAKSGRQVIVLGKPGTGKTFAAEAVKECFQSLGYDNFEGAATASSAASNLGDEIKLDKADSIAGLLLRMEKGLVRDDAKTAVFLDEAAMADPYSVLAIQKYFKHSKIVFLGDPKQLQSIEGSGWMKGLSERFDPARLDEITRQENSWHIQAINNVGMGRADLALEAFEQQRVEGLDIPCMNYFADSEKSLSACVDLYLKDPAGTEDKMMIASTNFEIFSLNKLAHERLLAAGKITGEQTVQVRSPKNPDDVLDRKIGIGEQIVITKNSKILGVQNSDIAVVEGIKAMPDGGHHISLRLAKNGKLVEISTEDFPYMDMAYSRTNYKAQGKTTSRAYIHTEDSASASREFWYVALSRSKLETIVCAGGEGEDYRKQLIGAATKSAAKTWSLDHFSPEQAMDLLASYESKTGRTAEALCARIGERDYQAKAAVVVEAIKPVVEAVRPATEAVIEPIPVVEEMKPAIVVEAKPIATVEAVKPAIAAEKPVAVVEQKPAIRPVVEAKPIATVEALKPATETAKEARTRKMEEVLARRREKEKANIDVLSKLLASATPENVESRKQALDKAISDQQAREKTEADYAKRKEAMLARLAVEKTLGRDRGKPR